MLVDMRSRRGLLFAALVATSACTSKPAETPRERIALCGAGSPEVGQTCHIHETTNPAIAARHVGVGNIFARELPGADGVLATRMSAAVVVFDPETKKEESQTVIVGSIVPIGAERYQVIAIHSGRDMPGSIVLKRLP
jgi:hypothetical protein